jgi:hypothetical protein
MALSLVDGNLAWQNVKIALMNAHPAAQNAFAELKKYLAQQKGNPQLQYKAFSEADCDAAGGTAILDAANTLYGVYVKKENSATDNFFWVYDDATNDGTAADARVCLSLLVANQEAFAVYPQGLAMAAGVVVTQYATDALGAVDGSNGGGGFVLVGAA